MKRKIILNYPPASSVWHLPIGIAYLAAILCEKGHEVIQRYSHIIGLEHLLKQHGGATVDEALRIVRDPTSGVLDWYRARMTFEQVSSSISTNDNFVVQRNNVIYVSEFYDGTIERTLEAIRNREQHLWYDYFTDVELQLALDFQPDIYGISVADERQFMQSLILASIIKDALPNCLIVLGGNFWSRVTGAFQLPEFARFFDFCDTIVYREGFQPMLELADTLDPRSASGTVWRDGDRVVVNHRTTKPTLFETIPTPHFDGGARQWSPDIVYPLYTISNCMFDCGFCAIAAGSDTFLKKPRTMSPQRIAEHMVKLGGHRFDILDETFPIATQLALGEELRQIGYKAEWQCYTTIVDKMLDEDVCHRLYEAGCSAVQLGLETLSPPTLDREDKKWNHPKNYGKIFRNLKKAGIQTHIFIQVGLPGEPLGEGLPWLPFLEDYGDTILTIKAGRNRRTRMSPEELEGRHSEFIEVLPDTTPLHLNRDFRYRNLSNKRVVAMRDLLEEACRHHKFYAVTSTIPWWINRGRYTWEQLEAMAAKLRAMVDAELIKPEPHVPHFNQVLTKVSAIVRDEIGQDIRFQSYEDVLKFARTL